MTFAPANRSELFDPYTGADIPVLKYVVFTPGVDSTFARPIHVQYVRDTMRGHGVQVTEECGPGSVRRSLLVFFGIEMGVFPAPGSWTEFDAIRALTEFVERCRVLSGKQGTPAPYVMSAVHGHPVSLPAAIAWLRPEPTIAEAPKDVRGEPLPFKLIQLHHFPATTWVGRAVFAPCGQKGDVPTWVDTDDDEPADASEDGPPGPHPAYDVGVVTRYEPDPDFADRGHVRVHFAGSHGSTLHYTAWNLWTPVEAP